MTAAPMPAETTVARNKIHGFLLSLFSGGMSSVTLLRNTQEKAIWDT